MALKVTEFTFLEHYAPRYGLPVPRHLAGTAKIAEVKNAIEEWGGEAIVTMWLPVIWGFVMTAWATYLVVLLQELRRDHECLFDQVQRIRDTVESNEKEILDLKLIDSVQGRGMGELQLDFQHFGERYCPALNDIDARLELKRERERWEKAKEQLKEANKERKRKNRAAHKRKMEEQKKRRIEKQKKAAEGVVN